MPQRLKDRALRMVQELPNKEKYPDLFDLYGFKKNVKIKKVHCFFLISKDTS